MKEPIEYLGHVNSLTTREELYDIGKQMQIDAYNEVIKNTAELTKSTATKFAEWINSIYITCQGGWMYRYQSQIKSRVYSTEELYNDFNEKTIVLNLNKP